MFALLRGADLPRRVARTLAGEAGLNDPVAVLLVHGLVELIIHPDFGALGVVDLFAKELAIGAAVGLALPRLLIPLVRRSGSAPLGIPFLGALGALTIAYGGAAALGGSGFLAVYLAGLMLGGSEPSPGGAGPRLSPRARPARRGGAVSDPRAARLPSQIAEVFVAGFALALVVAFVARPLAAAVALAFPRYSARERLVIGWAGLRGGVPVVLAVLAVVAGVPRSVEFFTVAFFAVVVSTLIQGITVTPLARRLGVAGSEAGGVS